MTITNTIQAVFAALLIAVSPIHAATITIVNTDGPGEGYNDPGPPDPASTVGGNTGATLGAQRLIATQFAAGIWAGILESPIEIRVDSQFNPLACTPTAVNTGLGRGTTAHRDFVGAPVPGTHYSQALANSLAGRDLSVGFPNLTQDDIAIQFNSALGTTCPFPASWYYGLDGILPAGTRELIGVVLHEIGHGLGFLPLFDLATGAQFNGSPNIYERFLEDHLTGKLFPDMTDVERVDAAISGPDLHFTGPKTIACGNAVLTAGRDPATGHIEMLAPPTVVRGSSVGHFSTTLTPPQLMQSGVSGEVIVRPQVDICVLDDLGWVLASEVPPPAPSPTATCNGLPAIIVGTEGNDTLIGTAGPDVIHGLGGNDVIRGLAGNDSICGGPGKDRLFGQAGRDKLFGDAGKDICNGGPGSDRTKRCERRIGVP